MNNPPDSPRKDASPIGVFPREPVLVLLLAFLGALTRLPWMSKVLYHWDSVNFSFAMRAFDMAKDQPQPPGYILYVWLTRVVDLIFHDAQSTMVAISVTASVLSIFAIYFLGKLIFSQTVGLLAALYLTFSPLFWFYGEIALPHTLDAFLVITAAIFLYRVMIGETKWIYAAVVILAVAGGVRQQTIVFLAPLILFSIRKAGWKHWLAAGLLGALLCLAWFIPLMSLTGGLQNYLKVMDAFSVRFQTTTSLFAGAGWFGLKRNVTKYVLYTLYAWSLFSVPLLGAAIQVIRRKITIGAAEKWLFFGLWILPVSAFYWMVHMGQQGLVFVYLPALLVISAYATEILLGRSRSLLRAGAFSLVVISAAVFLLLLEYPLGSNGQRLLTAATIANSDRYYQSRFSFIRREDPAASTIIISSNWHHLQYYLPEYKVLPFTIGSKWEVDEGMPVSGSTPLIHAGLAQLGFDGVSSTPVKLILFDPDLSGFNHSPEMFKGVVLPGGDQFQETILNQSDEIVVDGGFFEIVRK